ncbi:MAG: DUF4405 domain-containing protein [Planctomycetes bacterium]|nr:DUF4405 domain-containing protein [Planctomycetota bacterium]
MLRALPEPNRARSPASPMNNPQRPFRLRACISVVVALCFVVLVTSGAILFLAPPGRVANWTDWRIASFTKHDWANLHVVFAALFLIGGLLHVWFNWRPLVSYFKSRAAVGRRLRWEWPVALLVCIIVFAGVRTEVPPFSTLLQWSEGLRRSWEQPAQRAPIAHAEELTLAELCDRAGVPLAAAKERLAAAGVQDADDGVVIGQLAERNGLTPARVHELVQGTPAGAAGGGEHGAEGSRGGAGGGGNRGGFGRKTLRDACTDEGVGLDEALERLRAKGIDAKAEDTLRDVANRNGLDRPGAILEAIRGK